MNIIQIVYTNSNCKDVLPMFLGENKKYCNIPIYAISDYNVKEVEDNNIIKDIYIYDNNDPYYKVWIDALEKFNSDYFIYLQEDFILYNHVDEKKIKEYMYFLEYNPEYSFVRLLKSGVSLPENEVHYNLYEIPSDHQNIFSMQATIWRTSDYIKIMNVVHDQKWLENENYRKKFIELGMKGVYHFNSERKIGANHHDSDVYPYIATAIVRGKWNMKEYKKILEPLLKEYNIDLNQRGI